MVLAINYIEDTLVKKVPRFIKIQGPTERVHVDFASLASLTGNCCWLNMLQDFFSFWCMQYAKWYIGEENYKSNDQTCKESNCFWLRI